MYGAQALSMSAGWLWSSYLPLDAFESFELGNRPSVRLAHTSLPASLVVYDRAGKNVMSGVGPRSVNGVLT